MPTWREHNYAGGQGQNSEWTDKLDKRQKAKRKR